MPVTVVVGGQYGSEGKGKVAKYLAAEMGAAAAVRVGGPNSGHTVVSDNGETITFQQLPTAALLQHAHCLMGAGSYIDPDVLYHEIELAQLGDGRLSIDPHAMIITEADRHRERNSRLRATIGSTLSGTGAAVQRRIERRKGIKFASDEPRLLPYVQPIIPIMRDYLQRGDRVIVEGTQGFGLSLLHGNDFPYVTSRDTTAASFIAEAGVSPLDVDDIVMVLRAFPIRVSGNSGKLPHEITWKAVTQESGSPDTIMEFTSVTKALRRVARFDAAVVRNAVQANRPSRLVLNHLDYIDHTAGQSGRPTNRVVNFIKQVEKAISRKIDYYGFSPTILIPMSPSRIRCSSELRYKLS